MGKIVIGIHGLNNKPPRDVLRQWWKTSLFDGLRGIGQPRLLLRFKLVYWSDILYPAPLDPNETDPANPFHIADPYTPSSEPFVPEKRTRLARAGNRMRAPLDHLLFNRTRLFNLDALGHLFIRRRFKDLHAYYRHSWVGPDRMSRPLKDVIRAKLATVLQRYRRHDILLLAHSMGEIVAYDVLASVVPDIPVHTLVTLGSPLGNPLVVKEIEEEQRALYGRGAGLETPPGIRRRWVDLGDPHDGVCAHRDLTGHFRPNAHQVQVEPISVNNQYVHRGVRSHHKLYGYARTPECARILHDFLAEGKPVWQEQVRSFCIRLWQRNAPPNDGAAP